MRFRGTTRLTASTLPISSRQSLVHSTLRHLRFRGGGSIDVANEIEFCQAFISQSGVNTRVLFSEVAHANYCDLIVTVLLMRRFGLG